MRRLLAASAILLASVFSSGYNALAQSPSPQLGSLLVSQLRCNDEDGAPAIDSATPRLSWILQPSEPNARGLRQTAYRILVASSRDLLSRESADRWDSGVVASRRTNQIEYGGKPLASSAHVYWSVKVWDGAQRPSPWSAPAEFHVALLQQSDWVAKWMGSSQASAERLPIFRREFVLDKPVAEAVAYVSGLGQYELDVNGVKAGDAVMAPGWTDYRKTVFYNTLHLTSLLHPGRNALGILLGNGMYNVQKTPGRYTKFEGSSGAPAVRFQLQIRYADGSSTQFLSDASWRCRLGPITFSSIYGGEDYDARLAPSGWTIPEFDDSSWKQAVAVPGPEGAMRAQKNPPIRIEQTYLPQRITQPKPGVFVYDLGQNFAGWPEISVQGEAGTPVKLIPGELLDQSGLVSQASSGEPQWFSYTLSGNDSGPEVWHPRFSYYGFRYVQVETSATIKRLVGQAMHADVPAVGSFTSSDDQFNRIHQLIDAAIRSNMQSVLTDCPHREKLGWLEQSHLLAHSVMYNYDVSRLYEKISDDMRDAQELDGAVPEIAPEYTRFRAPFNDSPEWGSAIVLNPWLVYQQYGNAIMLQERYEEMKRYVDYLGTRAGNHIVAYGLGDWYDIGPGEPGVSKLTTLGFTATAIYYHDLITLRDTARLLGRDNDAANYSQLASEVRQAFNQRFYNAQTHIYDRGSQTAYAMPLALHLVPEEDRAAVLEKLVADIRAHQNHVTAGDIGFHFVVEALAEGSRNDVLYDMLSRNDAPSYGYQLSRGATTLTEAWDANPKSSQDHFMLGHAEEWFYRSLAGIDLDLSRPADEQIVIRPWTRGPIRHARATYKSAIGPIQVEWRVEQTFQLDVSIPPNTEATVVLPHGAKSTGGDGAALLREDDVNSVVRVASGQYHFEAEAVPRP